MPGSNPFAVEKTEHSMVVRGTSDQCQRLALEVALDQAGELSGPRVDGMDKMFWMPVPTDWITILESA
jgi:hypothetical protein